MSVRRRPVILSILMGAWALATSVEAADKAPAGYLAPAALPGARDVLPPPPAAGSPGEALDRAAFFSTRALKGTPRWEMATRDAVYSPTAFLDYYSCALGVRLEPTRVPALLRVVTRMDPDVGAVVAAAKNQYQHTRPFVGTAEPICDTGDREAMAKSWSYPSGHAAMAWALGLVLAELAPDVAAPVLARARNLGESRAVCGVHTVSDVEAGRTVGAMVVAVLHASADFRGDLEAARRELAAVRARPPAPALEEARCAFERDASARTPWAPRP